MSNLIKKLLHLPSDPVSGDDKTATDETGSLADMPRSTLVGLQDAVLSGWFRNETDEIFRGIPIRPEDSVVDVGCGDGGNLLFCARRGAQVTAIDIDPSVIAGIQAKLADTCAAGRYATHVSDANPLPLPDATATRVLCTEVIEHVDDPRQLLAELVRIGRPGALYLLTVPDALQENMQQHVAPECYFQKPNHVRIVQRTEFAEMVAEAGLEIREQAQYGFFWAIWWALFWSCNVDLDHPDHPVLNHWTEAWGEVLSTPQGVRLKEQLDRFMPKSQIIVACKP
jgi:ubiquinone/menaquinone biosynthesis C-methylase UbiE